MPFKAKFQTDCASNFFFSPDTSFFFDMLLLAVSKHNNWHSIEETFSGQIFLFLLQVNF